MSRRFRRRPLAGLAALVGLGLLAAGCSGGGGSAAPGGLEKTNLVVAAVPAMDSAGLYIAKNRGYFAAEGLNVTILKATSGGTAINGQLAGQFDVTVGNYVSYISKNATDPKADFKVLAAGSIMQSANQEILVPAHSHITTVAGLKGKSIAVNVKGNIGTLLVDSVLTDNAVQVDNNQFVPIPFPQMATAMAQHRVDAAWMPEPFVTQAEEDTGAVPLADSNQGSSQNLPIAGYMVTGAWLKKNPNTAAAFRAAVLKGQAVAATNPGAVQQGMEKFAGTSQQVAAIANDPEFPTQQNAVLLGRLASLMLNFGMLPQAYNVNKMIVK
ncbi:MAG TPA: ABC transporter substrate-binding protein [Streptosporangiaceae bacterium]|jgi:NitT/TauT family transport system substrate-binding protein